MTDRHLIPVIVIGRRHRSLRRAAKRQAAEAVFARVASAPSVCDCNDGKSLHDLSCPEALNELSHNEKTL